MTRMDRPRLKSVQPLSGYRLALTFIDDRQVVRNMSNDVERLPALARLKDQQAFASAEVADDGWAVEWPTVDIQIGADTFWTE